MNTSFSKKRHILEANLELEKKFMLEKIKRNFSLNLQEQSTEPQNPYNVKNLDSVLPQGTGGRSDLPEKRSNVTLTTTSNGINIVRDGEGRSWLLKDEKAVPLNMNHQPSTSNEEVLYSYSSSNWKLNDDYFNRKYEEGLSIYYKPEDELYEQVPYPYLDTSEWGNPEVGTPAHDSMIKQFRNDLRRYAQKYGKFAIKKEDRFGFPDLFNVQTSSSTNIQNQQPEKQATPTQPTSSKENQTSPQKPVGNNAQIVSPESLNKGESGQMTTKKSYLELYNAIRSKKMLGPENLKDCAQILRNWYDDWGRRVVYNDADHATLKMVAQYCAYQVKPNVLSKIFGQKGGSVDRDTAKIIDILTGDGDPKISQTSKYRLQKRRG